MAEDGIGPEGLGPRDGSARVPGSRGAGAIGGIGTGHDVPGWAGGAMRVAVDLNRCQAYAQCCFLAPESFVLRGREVLLHVPEPDASEALAVRRAAAACPVQAIAFEDGADASAPDGPLVPR